MGTDRPDAGLYPADRLDLAAAAAREAGLAALLLTPGPDLRYLTGYDAQQLERLTCLAVPAAGEGRVGEGRVGEGRVGGAKQPFLVVPRLELPAARASSAGGLGLEIIPWDETDDPYALLAERLGVAGRVGPVGLSDRMGALMVLRLRDALPGARQDLASTALRSLRIRKTPPEVAALRAAGEAIDRVHARVPGWLRAGRTERQVAADIADAILEEGHARVDFTIVGSGPNAASPHHEVSDRVLQAGDAVVVDIGGTMPSGYCSDCTRTYVIGAPPPEFAAYYQVLRDAQQAAYAAVQDGGTAEAIDAAAREPITPAGHGEYLLHPARHRVGLESPEDPHILFRNAAPPPPGM